MSAPTFIDHFGPMAERYDVVLCDVWGVVHNSLVASPEAHDALSRFRARGGAAVLITNAPRPSHVVKRQLDRMHVPEHAYDAIVSSGDVTRGVIAARPGQKVFWIGPERDRPLFDGLSLEFTDLEHADYIVCTGLFHDDNETPDGYRELFGKALARGLFLLCANPDLVVERGTDLIYCAGALADLYHTMGGEVLFAGKPHAPIYEEALRQAAAARGRAAPRERVIAIGDSIRTDMKGAALFGIDSLFVTAGIHAEEFGDRDAPDARLLAKVFAREGVEPTAVTRRLNW
ncbi:MAG TPA: TIGR01459 family HAD-type hydrolase [Xanthobacteraceae bacterium]|nr:TIGR01459 family HAD-type hydrolase [Xanthobacteraceae bacterium]